MSGIIVSGTVDFAVGQRDELLNKAARLFDEVRAQPGCEAYVWSADPVIASRVHVFERWTGTSTFAAHLTGPCYHAMLQLLGTHPPTDVNISKYRFDCAEPIYDENGIARADFLTCTAQQ